MRPARNLPWLLAAGVFAAACAAGPAVAPLPTPGPVGTTGLVYPLERGWHDGQPVLYYNLGGNTPLDPAGDGRVQVAPVWVFATGINPDGSPVKLEGQDSLFDTRAGEADYSDLWQVVLVTPDAAYQANTITSAEALRASGLPLSQQALFVNCPEVPAGSRLADEALPLKDGWVRGERVVYFDFGPTSPAPGNVYVFVTGFDAAGEPRLVPGQHFVFDAAPGTGGYSHFWRVNYVTVEAGYAADSIRAAAEVDPAQVTATDRVMNFPHK